MDGIISNAYKEILFGLIFKKFLVGFVLFEANI